MAHGRDQGARAPVCGFRPGTGEEPCVTYQQINEVPGRRQDGSKRNGIRLAGGPHDGDVQNGHGTVPRKVGRDLCQALISGTQSMVVKPKNIDEYLAALSDDKRAALERLRKIIRVAVPKAEECISYQLPAFRLDGKCFVWFGAAANHCAIYGVLGDHKDELKDYDISKGTIRFQADKAMPAALVRKLIKARIAENVGRSNKARQRRTAPLLAARANSRA